MADTHRDQSNRSMNPIMWLLNLFSSVRLGIVLLSLLFVYSSVGSAIPPLRQMRMFEMTEFQWFHWWPFDLLIALICLNIVVTTLRRIPLKTVNYGVWMVHSGIITLALGSVWYFSTKVEGEAPIARRAINITVPGAEPVTLPAQVGNRTTIQADDGDTWQVQVFGIDPEWELLSEPHEGERVYQVKLAVQRGDTMFIRNVHAGYPQYDEDMVQSDDPNQPFARSVRTLGRKFVDDSFQADLVYQPQQYMYLFHTTAIYVREIDEETGEPGPWVQRPVKRMPQYQDYVADYNNVWLTPRQQQRTPIDPLAIEVPAASDDDPLPESTFRVSQYLRYAVMDQRLRQGGEALNPAATVTFEATNTGQRVTYDLAAFDPELRSAGDGRLAMRWVESEEEVESLQQVEEPMLSIAVPDADVSVNVPIRDTMQSNAELGFTPIGDSGYSFRVRQLANDLNLVNEVVSIALVDVRGPDEREFTRLVFPDAERAIDTPIGGDFADHTQRLDTDAGIVMSYEPGTRPPLVALVAGPDPDQLRVMTLRADMSTDLRDVEIGRPINLRETMRFTVNRYAANTKLVTKPAVVPQEQRSRDVGQHYSMLNVEIPRGDGEVESLWLTYHAFVFDRKEDALLRFRHEPQRIELADGRAIEVLAGRERYELPAPVVLDDFELSTRIGGYRGSNSTVRNFTSYVRFATGDNEDHQWTDPQPVSVNAPIEHQGFWFFQSKWDAPSNESAGMNYTILGVGNRNGVYVMLLGCCIAVIGMIYAFYIKPIIKRKRQEHVYQELAAERLTRQWRENTLDHQSNEREQSDATNVEVRS